MTAAEVIRQEAFEDLQLQVFEQNGEEWFSAADIGKALGFSEPRKFVLQVFNRNRDEFEGLYRILNLRTWLKTGGKLPYRFTTFNPQGAYLLAILARTDKSKALRRWLAKFMAHDLDRLRASIAHLESQHQADQDQIAELHGQVGALTRELKKARKHLEAAPPLPALPAPQTTDQGVSSDIAVDYNQLRRLFEFARSTGYRDLPENWLFQLLDREAAGSSFRLEVKVPSQTLIFAGRLAGN